METEPVELFNMKLRNRIQQTRQRSMKSYCEGMGKEEREQPAKQAPKFYVDERHKLLYCYVPKVNESFNPS